MRTLLIATIILFAGDYLVAQQITNTDAVIISIPEKINWRKGNFETYCFLPDSSVVIISGLQQRINDSITFASTPALCIKKGTIRAGAHSTKTILYKTIYQTGKSTENDFKREYSDVVSFMFEDGRIKVLINGTPYRNAVEYTAESRERLLSIATKMAFEVELHPEKYITAN